MPSPQQTLLCQYRYNPLDLLIGHAQSAAPEFQRFYCKSRLATEVQGAIGHSIVQHGDLLLAQHRRHNGGLDTTLLATDLQRSVLHTLKTNQKQPIAYSPYGHRPTESGLTSLLGFNGERPDPVTGHYLLGNGYRAFNPVLMRFNSPDSLSPFGKGGLNSYMYCLGDPVNQGDPNGQSASVFLRALFTRTAKISGITYKLRPEKSISQVISARKEIKTISNKIKTNQETLLKKFKADWEANYAPPPESSQMTELHQREVSHFYESVTSYSKEGAAYLDLAKLDDVASTQFIGVTRRDNTKVMQLAQHYQKRISAIREDIDSLKSQKDIIHAATFRKI